LGRCGCRPGDDGPGGRRAARRVAETGPLRRRRRAFRRTPRDREGGLMSTFTLGETACPSCAHTFECEVVVGLNGVRRTDLGEAILNGSFQWVTCPSCGHDHEVESTFEFVDFERALFLLVHPTSLERSWRELE